MQGKSIHFELDTDSSLKSINSVFVQLFNYKWLIILIVFVSSMSSIFFAIKKPNVYTAKAMLVPAKSNEGGGLAKLAGQFGGLASMAGVSLGGDSGDDTEVALELVKSRSFLQLFIEKRELLPYLLAVTSWDSEQKKYNYESDVYNISTNSWVRNPPPGKSVIPTSWEGYDVLNSMIKTDFLRKKGLVTISVESISPELSMQIVTWLVEDLNSFWREKDMQEAEHSISYLQKQIDETKVAEMQSIFYELIAEQTKTKVLAAVNDDYLLKKLAPVVFPEAKSGPSRVLICIAGTLVGSVLALLIALILVFRKQRGLIRG
ncbi:Wzz/FepE/Etk N-terminal domain-containing protein [Pseudoalteromonas tunicata]|uniref:Wzz/FepE/Etk N-terminal domain-containing protein n=1 Tax=Pseudoalteromonas tunicata TaxID=314281 RepID=UPI00273F05D8|nr:Wzz/FepE/Etk N-terminal domain-containing protein [Pseudoalteromonas tunicata]MDP5211686.1 Wzz/FepE/Etk N-terminal domain-containing protein [Pseudoalteromonas tunicata]